MTQQEHRVQPYLRQPSTHRGVVRPEPVAGEFVEIVRQSLAVAVEVGTVGVAGYLHSLVRGQMRVDALFSVVEGLFEA
jgi:hypothetical protein